MVENIQPPLTVDAFQMSAVAFVTFLQALGRVGPGAQAGEELHRGLVPGAWDDLDLLREADRMAAESGDRAVCIETLDRCDLDAADPLLAEVERLRATTAGATSLEALEPIARLKHRRAAARRLGRSAGHAERAVAVSAPMGPRGGRVSAVCPDPPPPFFLARTWTSR